MPNSNPTIFAPIPDQVANEDVLFGMNIKNNFGSSGFLVMKQGGKSGCYM